MVKRYTSPAIIFTTADGPLVDYTDYAKLAAALREVLSDDARYPSGWASIAKARALLGLTAETKGDGNGG